MNIYELTFVKINVLSILLLYLLYILPDYKYLLIILPIIVIYIEYLFTTFKDLKCNSLLTKILIYSIISNILVIILGYSIEYKINLNYNSKYLENSYSKIFIQFLTGLNIILSIYWAECANKLDYK